MNKFNAHDDHLDGNINTVEDDITNNDLSQFHNEIKQEQKVVRQEQFDVFSIQRAKLIAKDVKNQFQIQQDQEQQQVDYEGLEYQEVDNEELEQQQADSMKKIFSNIKTQSFVNKFSKQMIFKQIIKKNSKIDYLNNQTEYITLLKCLRMDKEGRSTEVVTYMRKAFGKLDLFKHLQ